MTYSAAAAYPLLPRWTVLFSVQAAPDCILVCSPLLSDLVRTRIAENSKLFLSLNYSYRKNHTRTRD